MLPLAQNWRFLPKGLFAAPKLTQSPKPWCCGSCGSSEWQDVWELIPGTRENAVLPAGLALLKPFPPNECSQGFSSHPFGVPAPHLSLQGALGHRVCSIFLSFSSVPMASWRRAHPGQDIAIELLAMERAPLERRSGWAPVLCLVLPGTAWPCLTAELRRKGRGYIAFLVKFSHFLTSAVFSDFATLILMSE